MKPNTLEPMIECILNPFISVEREAPNFASMDRVKAVKIFHQSLPGYVSTPLVLQGLELMR